jgi:hypothetical protein
MKNNKYIYSSQNNNMQLLPALKMNIIIVHPRGVVIMMFTTSAGNN